MKTRRLALVGTLAIVFLGLAVWALPVTGALQRLSYDTLFALRGRIAPPPEIVLIYLDLSSAQNLEQPLNDRWDRSLHSQLLQRLRDDGARMVYYDIVFAERPKAERAAFASIDQAFAEEIKQTGRVILGAELDISRSNGVYMETLGPPAAAFRKAAAGWGLLLFQPIDPDYGVRELNCGTEDIPSASWVATEFLGSSHGERLQSRWLNYYGRPGTFRSYSFFQAWQSDGVAHGTFRDKLVFIGGRPVTNSLKFGHDEFANPYSRWGAPFMTGLEVHATEFANLWRGEWLNRLSLPLEAALIVAAGLLAGCFANFLSPGRAIFALVALGAALGFGAYALMAWHRQWCNWLVPVGIQIPVAALWSTSTQYFAEARRRRTLRNAFSLYLSEQMADRVAELDFDLRPGARLAEATVMFTDCKGFSGIAEELGDPLKLSALLSEYFTATSQCVLQNEGTIIKYIGDAIMALWGAPLEQRDHAARAVTAAWNLHAAASKPVQGRVLGTRVGLSTGSVAVGNLGSAQRFDFTAVGDVVNLAARLEGLNKHLGTDVLLSAATAEAVREGVVLRLLGHFATAGKSQGGAVYELLGPRDGTPPPEWPICFDEAITAIQTGRFEEAEKQFRKTIWQRGGHDGPSEFYLKYMKQLADRGELAAWSGVVILSEK